MSAGQIAGTNALRSAATTALRGDGLTRGLSLVFFDNQIDVDDSKGLKRSAMRGTGALVALTYSKDKLSG